MFQNFAGRLKTGFKKSKIFFTLKMPKIHCGHCFWPLEMIFMQIESNLEILGKKSFFWNFYLYLPLLTTIKYFGRNKSLRAQILASFLFLNGESEKVGLMVICRSFRLQVWRFYLTISINTYRKLQWDCSFFLDNFRPGLTCKRFFSSLFFSYFEIVQGGEILN